MYTKSDTVKYENYVAYKLNIGSLWNFFTLLKEIAFAAKLMLYVLLPSLQLGISKEVLTRGQAGNSHGCKVW